jgi:hypothetical protein
MAHVLFLRSHIVIGSTLTVFKTGYIFYVFFCFATTAASLFSQSRAVPFAGQGVMNLPPFDRSCSGQPAGLPSHPSHTSPAVRSLAQGVQPLPPPITAPQAMAPRTNPLINAPRAYEQPYWVEREPQQSAHLMQLSERPLISHPSTRPLSSTQNLGENRKTPKPTQRCRTSLACISCRAQKVRREASNETLGMT